MRLCSGDEQVSSENISLAAGGSSIRVHTVSSQSLFNELLCRSLADRANMLTSQSTLGEMHDKLGGGDYPWFDVLLLDNYSREITEMLLANCKEFLAQLEGIPVIIFNFYSEQYLKRWIAYGVRGILHEHEPLQNMIKAIKTVASNQTWFPRQAMNKFFREDFEHQSDPHKTKHSLTPREREVLLLIAKGNTNAQVAERLFISPYTVRVHTQNIYRKLGVPNRVSAALWANEHLISNK